MANDNGFTFDISLSVLNHLGRNLYRNFITVLGEGISNSWDADANNVWIYIDLENSTLIIKDDGVGMNVEDFKNKFLKVGYSKRGNQGKIIISPGGRPFIGRKGIGKLALLSCAKRVGIISKKSNSEYIGGIIDNTKLDEAITEDFTTYDLEKIKVLSFKPYIDNHEHGTIIRFEGIHEGINKSEEYLRKVIALYFKFSLVDTSFKIFLNDREITANDLQSLAEKTQFLWNINTLDDPYITNELTKLKKTNLLTTKMRVQGFIASVEKPRYLKIADTEEKTSIDLFVNGRLREQNILKHMPDFSTRHIASYLYGQIHYNELDGFKEDSFTTSRESIKEGDSTYEELLILLRDDVLKKIDDEWDQWRLDEKEEGDDENPRKSPKERKARSLFNLSSKEYEGQFKKREVSRWIDELLPDAEFNIPAYVDCFLSENLLRMHIEKKGLIPISCVNSDPKGQTCEDRFDLKAGNTSLCEYCKGERGKLSLQQQKIEAGISIQIRSSEEKLLTYLDYIDLAKMINNKILKNEDKPYKPLRNSVMHAARLTHEAKIKLTSVFHNVVATVNSIINNVDANGQPTK